MANPFKWFWNVATLRTKVLIIAPLLFVALLTAFWTFKGSLWVPEDSDDYKRLQGQNDQLREQNKELRIEAEAIKKERDGYQADLQKAGKLTEEGIQKQKEATEEYAKELTIIGVDIPELERCQRYCGKRADAGLPCRPDINTYCRLHSGSQ